MTCIFLGSVGMGMRVVCWGSFGHGIEGGLMHMKLSDR